MLKHAVSFLAGCLTIVVVLVVHALISHRRAETAATRKSGPVTATVTIQVAQDPNALLPVKDASTLLDRVADLTDIEKKKIRDAIVSGLVTEVRIQSDVGGESRWIAVPASGSSIVMRGASKAKFGPIELRVENPQKPNRSPEPRTAVP